MRWIKRFILRQYYRKLCAQEESKSKFRPDIEFCILLLQSLDYKEFIHYNTSQALGVILSVLHTNLESYTTRIDHFSFQLQQNKAIPVDWVTTQMFSMSFDRFLITNDGYYADVSKAIQQFQVASLKLCRALKLMENKSPVIYEHNSRMLTRMFVNIREVTLKMIEVSIAK